MNRYGFLLVAVLAGPWALLGAPADREKVNPAAGDSRVPPVLQLAEPSDSGVVLLPGPAPVVPPTSVVPAPSIAQPVRPASVPTKPVETALRPAPPKPGAATGAALNARPVPGSPKVGARANFDRDTAEFCQKQIGRWKQTDARNLLGQPLRDRPALDEKKAVNGRIYAFSDPSGRNKEIELDFDLATGSLRTVFAYPAQMTWRECLARWAGKVTSTDALQGRTFYSYLNRRLDVLVDKNGNVISLGLY